MLFLNVVCLIVGLACPIVEYTFSGGFSGVGAGVGVGVAAASSLTSSLMLAFLVNSKIRQTIKDMTLLIYSL
jgi:hypothetical protein